MKLSVANTANSKNFTLFIVREYYKKDPTVWLRGVILRTPLTRPRQPRTLRPETYTEGEGSVELTDLLR